MKRLKKFGGYFAVAAGILATTGPFVQTLGAGPAKWAGIIALIAAAASDSITKVEKSLEQGAGQSSDKN